MIRDIQITDAKILSHDKYLLKKIIYDYTKPDGTRKTQDREVYDRGDAAAVLLYNKEKRSIILTRQFRLPTYLNKNTSGMLLEVCAGLLDNDLPEEAAKREVKEETGYKIQKVKKIFEAYMSPGGVTELVYFFIAEYTDDMKVGAGGGIAEEEENIDVVEMEFEKAFRMIEAGEMRDGKTILLLQHLRLMKIL
jgi:nudix-type nucleoside diphosphatase (YffH/AdpP family)